MVIGRWSAERATHQAVMSAPQASRAFVACVIFGNQKFSPVIFLTFGCPTNLKLADREHKTHHQGYGGGELPPYSPTLTTEDSLHPVSEIRTSRTTYLLSGGWFGAG